MSNIYHNDQVNEVLNYINNLENDISIISSEGDEVLTNKYLLSVFSPTLRSLFSKLCCSSPTTLILSQCSSDPIQLLLSIITNGFTAVSNKASLTNAKEIIDTAKCLGIDFSDLIYSFETINNVEKVNYADENVLMEDKLFSSDDHNMLSFEADSNKESASENDKCEDNIIDAGK